MAPSRKHRPSIGANPLDAVVPASAPASEIPVRTAKTKKIRLTVHVPPDLLESVRDCVVALSGPPDMLALASFVEDAMRRELDRLRQERNKGKAFPKRTAELRTGRRVGR